MNWNGNWQRRRKNETGIRQIRNARVFGEAVREVNLRLREDKFVKTVVLVLAAIGLIALLGFFGMGAMMAGMMGRLM